MKNGCGDPESRRSILMAPVNGFMPVVCTIREDGFCSPQPYLMDGGKRTLLGKNFGCNFAADYQTRK
jgi:hypothetical protein